MAWHELQGALRVIAASPADRQALFVDVALLGRSLEEAALAHCLPFGTAKSRLHRTSEAVRAALAPPPGVLGHLDSQPISHLSYFNH